jgi:uncharacterized protein
MRKFCWLWLMLFFVLRATAQDIPPRPDPPRLVNDIAGILTGDEAERLEDKLDAYNDSTSTQIAIVTIKSTGAYDIAEESIKILRGWGIGTKAKDNGVLILVAVDDHKVRIETGNGMEGPLPDAICNRIIDGVIVPAFKDQHYYQGLDQATDRIFEAAAGEYKGVPEPRSSNGAGWPILYIIVIILIIIFIAPRGGGGRGGGTTFSRRGFGSGWIGGGFGGFGGGGFGGGGSSGGGGGFSGFGGGSGSGGGASGSW